MKKRSTDEALFEEESGGQANKSYLEMAAKTMKESNPGLYALQERAMKEIAAKELAKKKK